MRSKLGEVPRAELEADRAFYERLIAGQGPKPVNVFELNDRQILALIDRELANREVEEDHACVSADT